MCGIAGIVGSDQAPVDRSHLAAMGKALRHRGPDGSGDLVWNHVGLAHRRLAILDLSEAGHQPMSSADGRYQIVYNGEIYNHAELRREIEATGYPFRSKTDTEVLLAGFALWGRAVLDRLVGMFAFAILDTERDTLFLARDFFGIKPLYYTIHQGQFVFASEIKALLTLPGLPRRAEPERLYQYLRFGLTDHGDQTLFAGIRQLPSAHGLEIALDRPTQIEPVRYWAIDPEARADLSFDAAADRLREIFLKNIELHLRSDVPIGAALSGGIDSSAIVAAIRAVGGESVEIRTFSYIADDETLNEEAWVDLATEHAGARAEKVRPTPAELAADLDRLIASQDEPVGSTSLYAQRRVFQLAREAGVTVMLDGQGADELLGGYRPHLAARLATLLRAGRWVQAGRFLAQASGLPGVGGPATLFQAAGLLLPAGLQGLARRALGRELVPRWLNGGWFADRGVAMEPLWQGSGRERLREQLRESVVEKSLPMLLRYEDRNAMAFSIESRVPFLTPELASFALSLPEAYLIGPDGTSKSVFRQAMRGLVPDAILDRRDKIGFATPERDWLGAIRPWAERTLQSDAARAIPALRLDAVRAEWNAVLAGKARFDFRVWRWLNLIAWVERFGVQCDV